MGRRNSSGSPTKSTLNGVGLALSPLPLTMASPPLPLHTLIHRHLRYLIPPLRRRAPQPPTPMLPPTPPPAKSIVVPSALSRWSWMATRWFRRSLARLGQTRGSRRRRNQLPLNPPPRRCLSLVPSLLLLAAFCPALLSFLRLTITPLPLFLYPISYARSFPAFFTSAYVSRFLHISVCLVISSPLLVLFTSSTNVIL